jgi:hypothetical protein
MRNLGTTLSWVWSADVPGTRWIGGWVGPQLVWTLCPSRSSNSGPRVRSQRESYAPHTRYDSHTAFSRSQ